MEGFLIRRSDPVVPGMDGSWTWYGEATLTASLSPFSTQPMGKEFPHRERRHYSGWTPCSCPGCWGCIFMEVLLIGGWIIVVLGCGGTPTLSRGAILAARGLHGSQGINNQHVGSAFQLLAGRYQPERCSFRSPGWRRCRCVQGFLLKGCHTIGHGFRGAATMSLKCY